MRSWRVTSSNNRIFRMLDPRASGEAFLAWAGGIREKIPEDVVAIDGKTLRASLGQGKPPLHVVGARSIRSCSAEARESLFYIIFYPRPSPFIPG